MPESNRINDLIKTVEALSDQLEDHQYETIQRTLSLERRFDDILQVLSSKGVNLGFKIYSEMDPDSFEKLIESGLSFPKPELRALRITQRLHSNELNIRSPILIKQASRRKQTTILIARTGDTKIKSMLCFLEGVNNIDHKEIKYSMQLAALKSNDADIPTRTRLKNLNRIEGPLIFKKIFRLKTFPVSRGAADTYKKLTGFDLEELKTKTPHIGSKPEYVLFKRHYNYEKDYPDLFKFHSTE
tara:strand:+ start:271 stop:999 length:729 start_codon:yes stop_codon:yes gene_type:complete